MAGHEAGDPLGSLAAAEKWRPNECRRDGEPTDLIGFAVRGRSVVLYRLISQRIV